MRKNPDARGGADAARSETIGEEVRERLGEMTPSERRVARALLATYPTAGLESLPQLAEAASVTGPTVLRFVRKIGYDGYPDFQRSLRQEVQARTEGLYSLYETKVTAQDDLVVNRSLDAFTRALDATFSVNDAGGRSGRRGRAPVRPQAPRLVRGRPVQPTCSRATSACSCGCCGRAARSIGDTPDATRVRQPGDLARKSVLCLFDYRRYQPDTIAAGRVAAARGAEVSCSPTRGCRRRSSTRATC